MVVPVKVIGDVVVDYLSSLYACSSMSAISSGAKGVEIGGLDPGAFGFCYGVEVGVVG
jgi:hypothetical protein